MQRSPWRAVGVAFALACLPTVLLTSGDQPAPSGGAAISAVPIRVAALPATDRTTHGTTALGPAHRVVTRRTSAHRTGPPLPSKPITAFPNAVRTLTLTFDDGPDPRWTPTVLALLRQYHARAVFCIVGLHAVANPGLVRRIAREGHVLCDHSWTHDEHLKRRSAATIEFEVGHTAAVIRQYAGVAPRYYRAPGGNFSANVTAVAHQHGLTPLGWAVDPVDWAKPGVAAIVARVLGQAYPGAVVLMHDGYGNRSQSVAALRVLLPALRARGYHFVAPHQ